MFLYYIVYTCTMSHLGGQKDNSNGFTWLFYTDLGNHHKFGEIKMRLS